MGPWEQSGAIIEIDGAPVECDTCPCNLSVCEPPQVYPRTLTLVYTLVYRQVSCVGPPFAVLGGDNTVTWTTTAMLASSTSSSAIWSIVGAPHPLFACAGLTVGNAAGALITGYTAPEMSTQVLFFCTGGGDDGSEACWSLANAGTTIDEYPDPSGDPFVCLDIISADPVMLEFPSPTELFMNCVVGGICYTAELTVTISGVTV